MVNEKRLIDANALADEVDNSKHNNPHPQGIIKVNHRNEHDHFLRMILDAPTVDAVEVVHGRWIDEYPYVRCSVCNAEWINCRTDNEPKLFYYCPNCGAKMDGGNEDV